MTPIRKLVLLILVFAVAIISFRHAALALRPTLPRDMPGYSQFVVSGYDLAHNEPKGDWIACQQDVPQNTNFCRVTDSHGIVIFQGDFLPVAKDRPVPQEKLRVAPTDLDRIFVRGPAEGGLIPVIPLTDGELLVPAADSAALADRWARNPDERQRIEGL